MSIDDKDEEFSLPDFDDEEGSEGDSGGDSGDDFGSFEEDSFDSSDDFGSSDEGSLGDEGEDSFGEEDSPMDAPTMDSTDDFSSEESGDSSGVEEGLSAEGESGGEYEASIFSSGMSDSDSGGESSSSDYEDESADMYDYGKLEDKEEGSGGSKSRVFLLLVGIMCVVFVGLGGTYLWLKSKNKSEASVQESESPALVVVDTLSAESSDSVGLAIGGIGTPVGEDASAETEDEPSADEEPISDASSGTDEVAQAPPSRPAPVSVPSRVTPAQPARPAPRSTTPKTTSAGNLDVLNATTGRAYVIVASYSNRAAAMRHGRRLADQGHQVQIISPFARWRYYRVALANYATYREAAQQLGRYRREFGSDVWVLAYR